MGRNRGHLEDDASILDIQQTVSLFIMVPGLVLHTTASALQAASFLSLHADVLNGQISRGVLIAFTVVEKVLSVIHVQLILSYFGV